MKVGIFMTLLADRSLEEALDYVREAGCEAVEIGTGGYPGSAHCDPKVLLKDA
ncbi:MAG: sugar phosphate isomerase/epimerase, partial [Rubrobacteraceae bacterium]